MSLVAALRESLRGAISAASYDRLRTMKGMPARLFQRAMEKSGYVVARVDDYYSPLPSRDRLKSTQARWSQPSTLRGVEYDLTAMKVWLQTAMDRYYAEFAALPAYEEVCKKGFGPGYTRVDALVLYCKIRMQKPAKYLEVGSGVSTYYANAAALMNASEGFLMQITCIEPYPFAALDSIAGIVVREKFVQDEELETFTALAANDLLFIDSSHVVRLDGDVPFLFLEVLPALQAGVTIHIHDIPFPYHCPYPAEYWIYKNTWPMWWNESMLLHALLMGGRQFSVDLSAPLIRHHDESFLMNLIPRYKTVAQEPNTFSSIWLTKR